MEITFNIIPCRWRISASRPSSWPCLSLSVDYEPWESAGGGGDHEEELLQMLGWPMLTIVLRKSIYSIFVELNLEIMFFQDAQGSVTTGRGRKSNMCVEDCERQGQPVGKLIRNGWLQKRTFPVRLRQMFDNSSKGSSTLASRNHNDP